MIEYLGVAILDYMAVEKMVHEGLGEEASRQRKLLDRAWWAPEWKEGLCVWAQRVSAMNGNRGSHCRGRLGPRDPDHIQRATTTKIPSFKLGSAMT